MFAKELFILLLSFAPPATRFFLRLVAFRLKAFPAFGQAGLGLKAFNASRQHRDAFGKNSLDAGGDLKMNVRSFSLNFSQKVNLGNYETKGISLGASVELDESDDLIECKAEMAAKLNQLLEEEVSREKKQVAAIALSR